MGLQLFKMSCKIASQMYLPIDIINSGLRSVRVILASICTITTQSNKRFCWNFKRYIQRNNQPEEKQSGKFYQLVKYYMLYLQYWINENGTVII